MCGIALVFGDSGKSSHIVNNMLDAMSHRGNDSMCIESFDTCTVGHRRMAVTDIANDYPYLNPTWRVYLNGEIYNYKDFGFKGNESQVLEQCFEKYGIDFVSKLNGMFAIVAINKQTNDVYLIRDRYGIKPLYYYILDDQSIIVSSEIKAILTHPNYNFSINEYAKHQWFVFNNNFSNETLFSGINQIDKSSIFYLNKQESKKYWKWEYNTDNTIPFAVAVQKVRNLVCKAIKKMTPQEVNYGTCISSGIDSNIIYSQLPTTTPTFTAGFHDYKNDERSIVEEVSNNCYEVVYNSPRNFHESILALEDLKAGASFSNYGLFEMASKFVKVIFDGTGADELFGGYKWRYDMSKDYYSLVNRTGLKYDGDFNNFYPNDTLENRLKFDANNFMPAVLMVGDKMSMAHTVEMRVPFLDNDLVDYVLTLPIEFLQGKKLLRAAFEKDLPTSVLSAPKLGFSSPDYFGIGDNKALNWANAAFNEWLETFNTK
jgi:asparagine synthase (glutamine-hydrolysing)